MTKVLVAVPDRPRNRVLALAITRILAVASGVNTNLIKNRGAEAGVEGPAAARGISRTKWAVEQAMIDGAPYLEFTAVGLLVRRVIRWHLVSLKGGEVSLRSSGQYTADARRCAGGSA